MAVTITAENIIEMHGKSGRERVIWGIFKVTYDSSYPTGGEVWNLSQWFHKVWHIDGTMAEDGTSGGYLPAVTDTNFASPTSIKVEMFCQGGSMGAAGGNSEFVEATAARQMQSVVCRAWIIGE